MRGLAFLGVPIALWIVGLLVGYFAYSQIFTGAAGSACLPGAAGCQPGAQCTYTGNLPTLYQCVVPNNPFNQFQYFLNSFSISTLVCSPSGILSGFCGIAIPLVSGIIGAIALFILVTLLGLSLPAQFTMLIGFVIGFFLFSFINLYWWIILAIGGLGYFLFMRK